MNLLSLITILSAGLILLIGFRILQLDRRAKENRAFFILAITLSWLGFCWYEMSHTTVMAEAIQLKKLQFVWVYTLPLLIYCLYHFAGPSIFGIRSKVRNIALAILLIVSTGLAYLEIFTNNGHGQLILLDNNQWGLIIDNTNVYGWLRSLWFFVLLATGAYIAYRAYVQEKQDHLRRMKAIFFALISIFFSFIFAQNFVLPYFGYVHLVNASLVILTSFLIFAWAFTNFKPITYGDEYTIQNILESMTNLVIVTDKDFLIKSINPATERFFDCKFEQLVNQTICTLLGRKVTDRCIEQLNLYSGRMSEEMELETPHGIAYIHVNMSAVYNEANQMQGYTFIGTDRTKFRTAEVQLLEYAQQLNRSNEVLENFAYIASHDLKEPLRMISGFATLLERQLGADLDGTQAEYFSYITEGIKRMYALIESVMDVSKLDYRESTIEKIEVSTLVNSLANRFSTIEKDVDISYGPMPMILADHKDLEILFFNLIENGIKYNTSANVRIKISCQRIGEAYEFAIRDNGIGIDPAFHEHIFKMFKRLHTRVQYEGTGMGLAISKRIVESLGGRIWVEKPKGVGTTFKFTVPVHHENVKAVPKKSPLPLTQAS